MAAATIATGGLQLPRLQLPRLHGVIKQSIVCVCVCAARALAQAHALGAGGLCCGDAAWRLLSVTCMRLRSAMPASESKSFG